jgi:hypothetical protein
VSVEARSIRRRVDFSSTLLGRPRRAADDEAVRPW